MNLALIFSVTCGRPWLSLGIYKLQIIFLFTKICSSDSAAAAPADLSLGQYCVWPHIPRKRLCLISLIKNTPKNAAFHPGIAAATFINGGEISEAACNWFKRTHHPFVGALQPDIRLWEETDSELRSSDSQPGGGYELVMQPV